MLRAHQELWRTLADYVECEPLPDDAGDEELTADDLDELARTLLDEGSLEPPDAERVAAALQRFAEIEREAGRVLARRAARHPARRACRPRTSG